MMGDWMKQNSWVEGLVVKGLAFASSVTSFEKMKNVLM
jgi:hypothetical protein